MPESRAMRRRTGSPGKLWVFREKGLSNDIRFNQGTDKDKLGYQTDV